MKKINIIGCPGAGKSTFSTKLSKALNIPLYHMDIIWFKKDKTNISEELFMQSLKNIASTSEWIIDGNYNHTIDMRLECCDTTFLLDFPLNICLSGIESRIMKPRKDFPYIETEFDDEFREFVKQFPDNQLPKIYKMLDKYKDKRQIIIFKDRSETDDFLQTIKQKS